MVEQGPPNRFAPLAPLGDQEDMDVSFSESAPPPPPPPNPSTTAFIFREPSGRTTEEVAKGKSAREARALARARPAEEPHQQQPKARKLRSGSARAASLSLFCGTPLRLAVLDEFRLFAEGANVEEEELPNRLTDALFRLHGEEWISSGVDVEQSALPPNFKALALSLFQAEVGGDQVMGESAGGEDAEYGADLFSFPSPPVSSAPSIFSALPQQDKVPPPAHLPMCGGGQGPQ